VLQPAIAEANATLRTGPLPQVRGDRGQLGQLIQNLLSNAVKYRRTDKLPLIEVASVQHDSEWTVTVRDNGIGFRPEYAERIFGLFKRLHGREIPGTGVGLGICRRIVERHGGRIWAESDGEGRGATFTFTLPVVQ
jgi:light-regulated signal transduction histidine kinase (bacteriophytochrome)